MSWISVNTDLPENNEFVEVIVEANFSESNTVRSRQPFLGEFSRHHGWRVNECTGKLPSVICWRPFDQQTQDILCGDYVSIAPKKASDAQI